MNQPDQLAFSHDILLRREEWTVKQACRLIDSGALYWDKTDQAMKKFSQLRKAQTIAALICRIPVFPILGAEDRNGAREILRRITILAACHEFINDQFPICIGMNDPQMFSQLKPVYQNRIEDAHIEIFSIDLKQNSESRFWITELWDAQFGVNL